MSLPWWSETAACGVSQNSPSAQKKSSAKKRLISYCWGPTRNACLVLLTLNSAFYPSTSSTPNVSAVFSSLEEIQARGSFYRSAAAANDRHRQPALLPVKQLNSTMERQAASSLTVLVPTLKCVPQLFASSTPRNQLYTIIPRTKT